MIYLLGNVGATFLEWGWQLAALKRISFLKLYPGRIHKIDCWSHAVSFLILSDISRRQS
jgi:hypothetical protein